MADPASFDLNQDFVRARVGAFGVFKDEGLLELAQDRGFHF